MIEMKPVVSVAQLAEHWVVAPVVVGSSPITHPIKILSLAFKPFFTIFSILGSNLYSCFFILPLILKRILKYHLSIIKI
jgi:hypothetical protein